MTTKDKEQEILDKISELKAALIESRPDPKSTKKDPKPELPSLLKHHLINVDQKVTTQDFITKHFAEALKQIKDIHTEATKNQWTEFAEATPIAGGFVAALEKFFENREDPAVKWERWLYAALAGAAIVVLLPFFKGLAVNLSRTAQTFRPGGDNSPEARAGRRIMTRNPDGGWMRETLGAVNQREARVWAGGTSLADLVGNPANAQNAETLTRALEGLNPQVEIFNRHAPSFLDSFKRLPRESKATKAANAVGTMREAVKQVNVRKLVKLAEGLERLNTALGEFHPTKLPKEGDIAGTATAMNNLASETGTLRTKFQELQGTIRSLDQQIGTATGG
ncbi:hypothetical protein [Streptomyces filamentosus]|uniref:hypothetical protein n=1 Tax=Streptomyces filamentosus TaxID=67294 RepID=UPI001239B434|nr:hypothetical protein [Streptomyces filamentosus]KAA6219137.1 hypothetical protein CP979_21340 [Streptomyces filamentosus]